MSEEEESRGSSLGGIGLGRGVILNKPFVTREAEHGLQEGFRLGMGLASQLSGNHSFWRAARGSFDSGKDYVGWREHSYKPRMAGLEVA